MSLGRIIVAAILLGIASTVGAADLYFQHLGPETGLPSSRVQAFAQDQRGFIWVGTDAGLARFDGYETLVFKHDPQKAASLPSNRIRQLHVDRLGQLWVGTQNRGLSRFNPLLRSFTRITFQDYEPEWIYAIAEFADSLYIGTDNGLYELPLQQNFARSIALSQDYDIRSLVEDQHGKLWVGTRKNGLFLYAPGPAAHFTAFPLPAQADRRIFSLTLAQDNRLWIAYGQQLYSLTQGATIPQQQLAGHLPASPITALQSLVSGHIAIGTLAGLFLLNPATGKLSQFHANGVTPNSLKDQQIYQLFTARDGSLWVGTFKGGVSYTNPNMLKLGLNRQAKDCPVTYAEDIKQDRQGNVWVARPNGVTRIDTDGQCTVLKLATREAVNFIELFFDSKERLWAQLELGGLAHYDSTSEQFYQLDIPILKALSVLKVFESGPYQFWLGSERHGLFLFDPERRSITPIKALQDLYIHEIHPYQNGLLLATSAGALLYRHDQQTVSKPFDLPHGLTVQTLSIDESRNTVWLGTSSNGLYRSANGGSVVKVTQQTGFLGENIYASVLDRHNTVWVSSNQGLFRLHTENTQFHRLQARDGLQSLEASALTYAAAQDRLLVAGINGINTFNVNDIPLNPVGPDIALTRFTPANEVNRSQLVHYPESVELDHRNKDFSFELAALNFDDSSRNQYAYRLDNYDRNWIFPNANQRRASYTNLAPGTYHLRAKAANKDGVWGAEKTLLTMNIKPAPWLSWWAKTIYLFLAISVLYAIHYWRNRAAVHRAENLQQEVLRRTSEIAQQKTTIENLLTRKNDLFAAISHEFRTPLTLLLGPLENAAKIADDAIEVDIQTARRNALRLLALVDQLLAMAKNINNNKTELKAQPLGAHLQGLVELFRVAATEKNIRLDYQVIPADIQILADDGVIELVIGNLLSNAIKFSPTESTVRLNVEDSIDQVTVLISDQGPGICPHEQDSIFERFFRSPKAAGTQGTGLGLAVTKETLEANGGSIAVHSPPGSGTTFSATFKRTRNSQLPIESQPKIPANQTTLVTPPLHTHHPVPVDVNGESGKPLILIIEDNPEMRLFIRQSLSPTYHFAEADNGKSGIAEAIRLIPDIIISDIMMPGEDGYAVTRALRRDSRTSHIPIMLLTARTDQQSRIRGWRENIDEYLSKPFSTEELRARINSILVVRQILQRRFGAAINDPKTRSQIASSLPQGDQKFLSRLQSCLKTNYMCADFGAGHIGAEIAMSNRQVQRKLKALTDYSPSDYLREFRLQQAAGQLATGTRVGLVSEQCGFSSPNQFSRCFKARFGLTPKQYQQASLDN